MWFWPMLAAGILAIVALIFIGKRPGWMPGGAGCWTGIAILFGIFTGFLGLIFVCMNLFSGYITDTFSLSFGGWGWPFGIFAIFAGLYLLVQVIFLIWYFYKLAIDKRPQDVKYEPQGGDRLLGLINWKKGFAGRTFTDFATSMSVLVAIGIAQSFDVLKGNLWWAGQIAAMVSVISVASWVQRYAIEGPDDPKIPRNPDDARDPFTTTPLERWWYMNSNSLAAIMTAVAVLIPSEKNLGKFALAIPSGSPDWIRTVFFSLWAAVFAFWFLSALQPWIASNKLSKWQNGWIFWFFGPISILTLILLLGYFGYYIYYRGINILPFDPGSSFSNDVGGGLAMLSPGFLCIRQLIKGFIVSVRWMNAGKIEKFRYLDLGKTALLMLGSAAICSVQISIFKNGSVAAAFINSDIPQNWIYLWMVIYIIALVLMAVSVLIGVVNDIVYEIEKPAGWSSSAIANRLTVKTAQQMLDDAADAEMQATRSSRKAQSAANEASEVVSAAMSKFAVLMAKEFRSAVDAADAARIEAEKAVSAVSIATNARAAAASAAAAVRAAEAGNFAEEVKARATEAAKAASEVAIAAKKEAASAQASAERLQAEVDRGIANAQAAVEAARAAEAARVAYPANNPRN